MLEGVSTTALLIYVSLLVIALIGLTLLVLLIYSGLLRSVDDVGTSPPPIGRAVVAYKFQKGPYSSAGQIFTEAACIAPNNKAIGIYYDDVDKVDSNETRYVVGSILSEDPASVDKDLMKQFAEKDYKIMNLPEVTYAVQTRFPHITTLSILIAVHKAYPRLKGYIEEHQLCAYPFIELYDGETIHFIAPLSKQDEFYVPECDQKTDFDQSSSAGDRTMLDTSLSDPVESNVSQDLGQAAVEDDPETQDPQKDPDNTTQSETTTEDPADDAEDSNDNNNIPEENVEERVNDEEQVSDDSSSSFEVLKTEPAE